MLRKKKGICFKEERKKKKRIFCSPVWKYLTKKKGLGYCQVMQIALTYSYHRPKRAQVASGEGGRATTST